MFVAERSVFEDRGGGDLMWSGGRPGAGYDTVVLTVEGGRMVGRFGGYRIHAERDGRGGMAGIFGMPEDGWCGVDSMAEEAHEGHAHGPARAFAGASAGAPPAPVSNPRSHDRLDILVAYTATAAENWKARGVDPVAAIRHAGDYMKMVFRNNSLPVEPHIVHIAQASAALDRAGRDRGRLVEYTLGSSSVLEDGEILRLRHEHRADFVHLFTGEAPHLLKTCAVHSMLMSGGTAEGFFHKAHGFTSNHPVCGDYAANFVHEVGHGLGADHEPAHAFRRPEGRIRPYAAGHVNDDIVPTIGTAMAYGGQVEPFFSTSRFDLYGAALGVEGEADNERTLRETVHIGARYSDYLPLLEDLPAQPTDLQVRYEGGAARLSWRDNAPDADGYELEYGSPYLRDGEFRCCFDRTVRLDGRTGATVPLEHTEPGAPYEFRLRARKGEVRSLRGSVVRLRVPGGEAPAAPSDLSVTVGGTGKNLDFHWTDNSDNEAGFDLQILLNGEPAERYLLPPDSEHMTRAYFILVFGGGGVAGRLLADTGVDYGARVVAFNAAGQASASEEVAFRWEPPDGAGSVEDLTAFAVGPTTARVAWTVDPKAYKYSADASFEGGSFSKDWTPESNGVNRDGATVWLDFEGLARGGRYTFKVFAWEKTDAGGNTGGGDTRAYLTMRERGPGPAAPSALSAERIDRDDPWRARLNWRDNSIDELGFVVQYQWVDSWSRVALVPADTESIGHWNIRFEHHRVFAYNEHGYSLSSPRVYIPPPGAAGTCRADAETLCLRNSRFEVSGSAWKEEGDRYTDFRVVNEGTDDSGLFYIFDPDNWEILVKVLDGCAENGHMWVLTASTTSLGHSIRVKDTVTGEWHFHSHRAGRPAPAIVDTEAFSLACGDGAAGR